LAVGGWHDFYILAGTASATLVGLLFVGLSLHLRVVVAIAEVRGLARVTLSNFGAVLFVSLFIVVPQDQRQAAFQLIGAGIVSLIVTVPSLLPGAHAGRRLRMDFMQRARVVLRSGISILGYLAIIAGGILLASSSSVGFAVLMIAVIVLLVISLRNTWDLLVTVGDMTMRREKESS
jgi:hypothetical protein